MLYPTVHLGIALVTADIFSSLKNKTGVEKTLLLFMVFLLTLYKAESSLE